MGDSLSAKAEGEEVGGGAEYWGRKLFRSVPFKEVIL